MSAVTEITLYCDAIDSDTGFSCGDAISYEAKNPTAARKEAAKNGWSCLSGKDRCVTHTKEISKR